MKRVLFATCLAVVPMGTAHATGTIECVSPLDDGITAFISVGRLPVLSVLRAEFTADGAAWVMPQIGGAAVPSGATEIAFGQGVQEQGRLSVDFTNADLERIIIKMRTVSAFDDKAGAQAGVLIIEDAGVWPVVCENG